MRILPLIIIIVGLWVVDALAFDGRYRRSAWQAANYQGQKFEYEIDYWLKRKLGLVRLVAPIGVRCLRWSEPI